MFTNSTSFSTHYHDVQCLLLTAGHDSRLHEFSPAADHAGQLHHEVPGRQTLPLHRRDEETSNGRLVRD